MGWRWSVMFAAVAVTAVCAEAQTHDATWAQRQIFEAQCGTWARDQARDEYAPKLRDARQQLNSFSASRTSVAKTGAALAASNIGLLQVAQQSREKELLEACVIQREAQFAPARTEERPGPTPPLAPTGREELAPRGPEAHAPKAPTRSKLDTDKRDACDWGEYWSSSQQRCVKIGGE